MGIEYNPDRPARRVSAGRKTAANAHRQCDVFEADFRDATVGEYLLPELTLGYAELLKI